MLSYDTIEFHTLELLKSLMQEPAFSAMRLVGGTALALQYGHRQSIDLDFFGDLKTEDNSRSQKNKIIKEVEYMTELRDKSVLHEAQAHIEAYKRGEEWAKKDVFDNVDDLMADLMKE